MLKTGRSVNKANKMNRQQKIHDLNKIAMGMTPAQIIRLSYKEFGPRICFASSLSEEDQVITDLIFNIAHEIEIFTLDTGRLFREALELLAKTQKKYPMTFKVYYPDNEAVEDMVRNHGINLFYESIVNRKLCCGIRKVEPLKRALQGVDAWMCGLRRAQSMTRSDLEVFEWDRINKKIKISPLADWSLKDVRRYVKGNSIDVNPLHKKGFISIGCSCCTRAVKKGEDIRAGRWWWEGQGTKECSLHASPKRRRKIKK